jgi:hypothetical protein
LLSFSLKALEVEEHRSDSMVRSLFVQMSSVFILMFATSSMASECQDFVKTYNAVYGTFKLGRLPKDSPELEQVKVIFGEFSDRIAHLLENDSKQEARVILNHHPVLAKGLPAFVYMMCNENPVLSMNEAYVGALSFLTKNILGQ